MNGFTRVLSLNLISLMLLGGCQMFGGGDKSAYQTVPNSPARDEAAASRLNAEALDLIQKEDYVAAEERLKLALAADVTHGPAHNNLGLVYFAQSKMYLAAWEFEHAAKLMPHHSEPRNNLGLVYEKVGKIDDAVDRYSAALIMQPDHPEIVGNLARAKFKRGDYDKQFKDLLTKLVMTDVRETWLSWAKLRLALMGQAVEP